MKKTIKQILIKLLFRGLLAFVKAVLSSKDWQEFLSKNKAKKWLKYRKLANVVIEDILGYEKKDSADTYLKSFIEDKSAKEKLHCEFCYQLLVKSTGKISEAAELRTTDLKAFAESQKPVIK